MHLAWQTLMRHVRANHAQARAKQATAEATLLVMRRPHECDGQDNELEAWLSDAHGVAGVARALAQNQGGTIGELGRHHAHDKARSWGGNLRKRCKLGVHTSAGKGRQGFA